MHVIPQSSLKLAATLPQPLLLARRRATTTTLPRTPLGMSSNQDTHPSPKPRAASRLLHSVKRTLTPTSAGSSKRYPEYSKSVVYSTYEESRVAVPQHFREPDPSSSRPTIEQIAMGLHISRTPHLRPLGSPYAFSQRNTAPHSANHEPHHHRTSTVTLPPPPSRSSLKKPSTVVTSSSSSPAISTPFSSTSSSTTATSFTVSSGQSPRSFAGIKSRMARLLPHNRSSSAPSSMLASPVSSPRSSADFPQPKKAVRFTTEEAVDIDASRR